MIVDDFYDMLKRSVPKKKKKKKTLFNLRGSQALSYLIFNLIFFHDVRNLLTNQFDCSHYFSRRHNSMF